MENIDIREGKDNLTKTGILELYNSVGWSNYTDKPDELMKAISNSSFVVTAHIENKIVGFARSVSDDCSIHYLQDILIHPEYHKKGIGRKLLNKCLERFKHVKTHVILTDDEEKQKKFYESLGYKNTKSLNKIQLNCYVKMNNINLE